MYEEIKNYTATYPKKCRLLSGEKKDSSDPDIIAFCSSLKHPVFLTKGDIAYHKCFLKKCSCLRKLANKEFWQSEQKLYCKQKDKRFSQKGQRFIERNSKFRQDISQKNATEIKSFIECWVAENLADPFIATSVKPFQQSTKNYTVFYVSKNKHYDAYEFVELLKAICAEFDVRIKLVHIKNTFGEYVTVDEFFQRKKKTIVVPGPSWTQFEKH